MQKIFCIAAIMLCSISGFAQDFSFGKITKEDLNFNRNTIDSNANAVVLREYGNASILIDPAKGGLMLEFYYHIKTKIFTKEGFSKADFTIPLYTSGNSKEVISSIKGVTYNLNGEKIAEYDLDKSKIFNEKSTKSVALTKLTLPNIQEGSIIELRYTINSPFLYNFRTWKFQDDIPKVYSEFVSKIPEICIYNQNMRGSLSISRHTKENYNTDMRSEIGEVHGSKTTYGMENIPAFVNEDYMTSADNWRSSLSFELASYRIPMGANYNYTRTWEDVEKQLFTDEDFGGQIKKKGLFKAILPSVIADKKTELEKAKAIHSYINKQIKWDKSNGLFTDKGIKDALEKRSGNVADINLALIAALNAADINANPLILSTRANGYPNITNPVLSDFNYVVAQVNIDSTVYYLDATESIIPFGSLPLRCINYQGRLFPKEGGSQWVELKAKEKSTVYYDFTGKIDNKGKLKGNLQIRRLGFDAYNKRKEIKEYNSMEEYFEKVEENNSKINYLKSDITHVDSTEYFLVETFDIEIDNFCSTHQNDFLFNPLFIGKTSKNPFNLEQRNYPIDIGSTVEEVLNMEVELPEGYQLKEKPKNVIMSLPNKDARYFYTSRMEDNKLHINVATQINKPFFMPEEYFDLKEFFSRIIQSQKLEITVSKI
ncbi:transglutaminase domain-containing protein [Sphingobacterium spiritivorum]|uniref:transglutaminase domain-containing protein n=1 Tax=Sphingobacterium spiritivorum TaxID=258 RepID=UPI003DA3537C